MHKKIACTLFFYCFCAQAMQDTVSNGIKITTLIVGTGYLVWKSYKGKKLKNIIEACKDENLYLVKKLIELQVPINIQDISGSTPLHYAVISGNIQVVEALLNTNAQVVNMVDNTKTAVLHYAALFEDLTLVEKLIAFNADVQVKDKNNMTPLLYATQKNHNEIAQRLIAAGAYTNVEDRLKWTPFHYAAENGNYILLYNLITEGTFNKEHSSLFSTKTFPSLKDYTINYIANNSNKVFVNQRSISELPNDLQQQIIFLIAYILPIEEQKRLIALHDHTFYAILYDCHKEQYVSLLKETLSTINNNSETPLAIANRRRVRGVDNKLQKLLEHIKYSNSYEELDIDIQQAIAYSLEKKLSIN